MIARRAHRRNAALDLMPAFRSVNRSARISRQRRSVPAPIPQASTTPLKIRVSVRSKGPASRRPSPPLRQEAREPDPPVQAFNMRDASKTSRRNAAPPIASKRSPDEPTGRANARPMTGSAISEAKGYYWLAKASTASERRPRISLRLMRATLAAADFRLFPNCSILEAGRTQ
jgi:hypothetical protein